MRILISGYIGKRITGIGRVLVETVNELAEFSPLSHFTVYINHDNKDFGEKFSSCSNISIKYYPITKNSSLKNLLFTSFIFPFLAVRHKADLIYLPNFTFILFKIKPTVCIIHDMIEFKLKDKFSKARTLYRHFIVPRMAKLSDHVITVSQNSKRDIVEICGINPSKISVVYNGIPRFMSNEKPRRIVEGDYMLYVGTVDYPGKNVFNALKAFEKLKRETRSKLKFVICGMPGKGYEVVEREIRMSPWKEDILCTGYLSDDGLFSAYTFAKIFIFLSYYEGFGLPILEAMRFGVPVITSNQSSLPEIAGDAAIICDPDNIEEVERAILRILSDPTVSNELVQKGYENLKRFSWRRTAEETHRVFASVLSTHSDHR